MSAPGNVRYARTSDGIDIAYMTFGEGESDLVFVPGFVSHLDLMWDLPWFQLVAIPIAKRFRVTVFDKRGTGLSDRSLGFGSLEERAGDLTAVMDAARVKRAVVYGASESGPMACLFAAQHPDRVVGLVLYGSFARLMWAPDYPMGATPEFRDNILPQLEAAWGTGDAYGLLVQHSPDPDRAKRALARFERNACTPQMAVEIMERNFEIDVRPVLPAISIPTVVAHCSSDPMIPAAYGRYLADHIPGATYAEIDGDFHASWRSEHVAKVTSATDPFFDRLLGAGTASEPARPPERVLATVMFTDIVGSTDRAVSVGDAAWVALLDEHDRIAAQNVGRFGGRLVKTTGDGLLAIFDGPSGAVNCARAVTDAIAALGLEVRAGVHTGEIERRADDVGGIGVHIAGRVADLVPPGEVWVSRTVKDLTAGSDLKFVPCGGHVLKGVPDEWELFRVSP